MILVALDPGIDFATALFDQGALQGAWFRDVPPVKPDLVVIEFPKYYPGGAPPSSPIEIAFSGGLVIGELIGRDKSRIKRVDTVSQPKSVIKRRVIAALESFELGRLGLALADVDEGKQNNVIDAVRHGLVFLNRMTA